VLFNGINQFVYVLCPMLGPDHRVTCLAPQHRPPLVARASTLFVSLLVDVMAQAAQRLPVVLIPEQLLITSMWFDVIDY
jgi:hypothetical protein